MTLREASIATRRFGLGPKPGDLGRIAPDPRGYVLAALADPAAARLVAPELKPSPALFLALRKAQDAERLARLALQQGETRAAGKPDTKVALAKGPEATPTAGSPTAPAGIQPPEVRRDAIRDEAAARIGHAAATDAPFVERLVMFWSNHFCIAAQKAPAVQVLAGAFEREAIRPHVLGRFGDMLKAVEQHPAMQIYLDNQTSTGPDSPAGRNRGRGLNENLAREILELHTLGVGGGYSQADVTSFAKVLTGWGVADLRTPLTDAISKGAGVAGSQEVVPGTFFFAATRHEPGPQTVLGKVYDNAGVAMGEHVLADLARHPSTARFIAAKLASHFISQTPPPELVARLEKVFRDTHGDLGAVSRAMATAPECWTLPARKVVPPYDFGVALIRAFDLKIKAPEVVRVAASIGQRLWHPPSPKGWPDDDDSWMGPAAVRERLRIAERIARDIDRKADPRMAAADLFGETLSNEARLAVERAETREQGFELLIMSPEFLRR